MPTATDVVREALLQPIPCPNCGSTQPCRCHVEDRRAKDVERQADLIVAALIEFGHLKHANTLPSEDDLNEAAMYIAARSRHARYTSTSEGWKLLRVSAADVNVAYTAATKSVGSAEQEALARARNILLDEIARRGPRSASD